MFLKATVLQISIQEGCWFSVLVLLSLCFIPVSHHWLLSSRILTKDGANGGTGGFKGILVQIQSIEHSVMKPNCQENDTMYKKEKKLLKPYKF